MDVGAPPSDVSSPASAATIAAIRILLDPRYIEHDAFWMFSQMMSDVEQLFYIHEVDSKALALAHREAQRMGTATLARRNRSETDVAIEKVREAREKSTTPVDRTCNRIHHEILHVADPDLHKRMVVMEVDPRLYALPWVRLVYCRCFHMEDVLTLWEGIFSATNPTLLVQKGSTSDGVAGTSMNTPVNAKSRITEMIECMVRQWLCRGEYLMGAESMFMLQRLMKYPPVEDVSVFVQRACEIRSNPGKCFAPAVVSESRRKEIESKNLDAQRGKASAAAATAFSAGASTKKERTGSNGNLIGNIIGKAGNLIGGGSKPAFPRPALDQNKSSRRSQFEGQKIAHHLDREASKINGMKALQERMGEQLGYISKVFEAELCGKSPEEAVAAAARDKAAGGAGLPYDETIVLQALAQLKQVKDVLAGRIGESVLLAVQYQGGSR